MGRVKGRLIMRLSELKNNSKKLLLTYCILKQLLFKGKDESVIEYGQLKEKISNQNSRRKDERKWEE